MSIKRKFQIFYNQRFRKTEYQAKLVASRIDDTGFSFIVEHPALAEITELWVKFFIEQGASNFVEMTIFDKATMQDYMFTMRKRGRYDKFDVIKICRNALNEIAYLDGDAQQLRYIAQVALDKIGWDDHETD